MSWLEDRKLCAVFHIRGTAIHVHADVTPRDWPYLESPRVRDEIKETLVSLLQEGAIGDHVTMDDLLYVETLPDRMTTTLKIAGNKAGVPYYDISTGDGKVTRRAAVKDHYLRTGEIVDNGKGPRPASLAEGAPMYDTYDPKRK